MSKYEVHTLNMKKRYEKLKEELKVIDELRLLETSSYYLNDKYEMKTFDSINNIFYSVDAYDMFNEKVILLVSELREDHAEYEELYDKFDDSFLELSFDEYRSLVLPLIEDTYTYDLAKKLINELE